MAVGIPDEVFGILCWLIAVPALFLAGLLGAAGWYSALRMNLDGSSKVFARGFVGVSAALAGAIGLLFAVAGFLAWFKAKPAVSGPVIFIGIAVAVLFLAIELMIAGSLYRRVRNQTGRVWPAVLSWGSYALGGLITLVAFGAFFIAVFGAVSGPPKKTAEVRRYESRCDDGRGTDCNMAGLRYSSGMGTEKDEMKAISYFQRSCDLGFEQGCRNLARAKAGSKSP
jgi:hypothetical protein